MLWRSKVPSPILIAVLSKGYAVDTAVISDGTVAVFRTDSIHFVDVILGINHNIEPSTLPEARDRCRAAIELELEAEDSHWQLQGRQGPFSPLGSWSARTLHRR